MVDIHDHLLVGTEPERCWRRLRRLICCRLRCSGRRSLRRRVRSRSSSCRLVADLGQRAGQGTTLLLLHHLLQDIFVERLQVIALMRGGPAGKQAPE